MKLNKTYTRFLGANLCIGFVAIILLFPFFRSTIRNQEDKILQESYQEISRSFEEMTKNLDDIRYQASLIRQSEIYSDVLRIADDYQTSDYVDIVNLRNYITSILVPYNDIIFDHMLLYKNSDMVIARDRVYLHEENLFPLYIDFEGLSEGEHNGVLFQNNTQTKLHPSQTVIALNRGSREVVCYSIPLETRNGETLVMLQVLLDINAVNRLYFQTSWTEQPGIILTDSADNEIYSNAKDAESSVYMNTTEAIVRSTDFERNEIIVFSMVSDNLLFRLRVIHEALVYNNESRQVIVFIMLYLFLSSGIFIFLACITSYWEYKPMRALLQLVKSHRAHETTSGDNDFEIIGQVFLQTLVDKDMLMADKTQIEDNLQHLVFTQLLLISDYKVEDPDLFENYPDKYVGICVISDNSKIRLIERLDDANAFSFIEEKYIHEISNNRVFILVEAYVELKELVEKVRDSILTTSVSEQESSLYYGISDRHVGLYEIRTAYQECILSLHYRNSNQKVLCFSDFNFTTTTDFLLDNWSVPFRESLLAGDRERSGSELCTIFNKINESKPESSVLQLVYTQVAGCLAYARDKLECKVDLGMLEAIDFSYSIEEIYMKFSNFANIVCEQAMLNKKSMNIDLRDQIIAFIETHYRDGQFYTRVVAEHFNISEKYVSSFLKEHTGYGFSEYVEKLRLAYANTLLRGTTYSIKDVAEKSGYNTISTFYKSYKRVFGISPGQLR